MLASELILHHAGRGWYHIVRGCRRYNDVVDIVCGKASHFQCRKSSFHAKIGGRLRPGSDMSGLDARAGADPLITGIDHSFKVCIGKDLLRRIMSGTQNSCRT